MPDKLITNYYYLYHKLERLPATAVFLFSPNPDPDKSVKQRKIQRYENLKTTGIITFSFLSDYFCCLGAEKCKRFGICPDTTA